MAGTLEMGTPEFRNRLLEFDRAVTLLYPGRLFRLVLVGGGADERLVPLNLGTKVVECYAASVEDIVASKLYLNRPTDAADVHRPEVLAALNWDRLAEVVADMEGSKLIERRHRQFLDNYDSYRKECEPCDA